MPTYQFDPAKGEAVEVSNYPSQQDEGPAVAPEEIERFVTKRAAQDMAQRARYKDAVEGDVAPVNLDAEVELAKVQQKLFRGEFANSLEEQQLINQAEALASKLVGGEGKPEVQQTELPLEQSIEESAKEIADNPEVQKDLQYAADVMSEELVGELNEVLTGEDELARAATLDVVKNLRQDPTRFVSREESTGISSDTEALIASQYGEETAHAISVLGNGVAQGVISPSQAIKTASGDPALQRALFNLAKEGVIRIAL